MTAESPLPDLLVSEDLMLLLLPPSGQIPELSPALECVLTGGLLVDMIEAGFIEVLPGEKPHAPLIRATEVPRPHDPMFVNVIALLGQDARPLADVLPVLLPRLDDVLLVRLANHGILTQHTAKFLFIIPTMSWRVVDPEPEEHLCESLAAVMEGRVRPDVRTGSIIALLSAAGVLPKLSASLPWNSAIAGHVQQIAMAGWATPSVKAVLDTAEVTARRAAAESGEARPEKVTAGGERRTRIAAQIGL